MKQLTKDALCLLDKKVEEGEEIKLWLVWNEPPIRITALRAAHGKLYVNDDPTPLTGYELRNLRIFDYCVFDNYWHAYAYFLRTSES